MKRNRKVEKMFCLVLIPVVPCVNRPTLEIHGVYFGPHDVRCRSPCVSGIASHTYSSVPKMK